MINNKQVNIWRGSSEPPTIYHIWVRNESQLLLYNGTKWVVFVDSATTVEAINAIIERLDVLENSTINGKKLSTNPILSGSDIQNTTSGKYINSNTSIANNLLVIDNLLDTQIIER